MIKLLKNNAMDKKMSVSSNKHHNQRYHGGDKLKQVNHTNVVIQSNPIDEYTNNLENET